jgi:peptidoglycan-associated lipoprotein
VKVKHLVLLIILASFVMAISCKKPPPPPEVVPPPVAQIDTTTPTPPPPPEKPPVPPLQVATIYFDYDKADIRSDARDILSANGRSLTEHPTATIRIEGNCDERGTEQYNLALGERRANAARDYLVNYGVNASRITTISYGEEHPVAQGHDESAWSRNRRADFAIISE